jgi:hypothetical protein
VGCEKGNGRKCRKWQINFKNGRKISKVADKFFKEALQMSSFTTEKNKMPLFSLNKNEYHSKKCK